MIRVLFLLPVLALALGGCRSPDPLIREVKIVPNAAQRVSEAFSPNPAVVPVGGTVIWINRDNVAHAVEGESREGPCAFRSGEIVPGKRFSRIFTRPARCRYICRLHGLAMQGRLEVRGAQESPPPSEPSPKRAFRVEGWGGGFPSSRQP